MSSSHIAAATPLFPAMGTARALVALTKPRVAFASVLTALTGYAATPGRGGLAEHLALLAGAWLAGGGVLAFNQWWERDTDALMGRTRQRPLVLEQLTPGIALTWSIALCATGLVLLATVFNMSAAAAAAAIIVMYGGMYTPMKRKTPRATEIGSISGALPPLLGSAAAGDLTFPPAVLLAVILLFWQMPHFYAIGWIYRADYRAAGLPLLPAIDASGRRTAMWSLGYCIPLAAALLLPWPLGFMGPLYGITATMACAALLFTSCRFLISPTDRTARVLFRATLLTLMPLMLAIVFDR